jgi:hypothetical protein
MRIDLHPLSFILLFLNQFWIANKLVSSFYEAMAGSLSISSTAVSSAKVAVVDSSVVGRSALYVVGIIMALGHCLELRLH